MPQLRPLDDSAAQSNNQLTSLKGLENLTQLTGLSLGANPDLPKAQIAELKKALPKCYIQWYPKK